VGWGPGRGANTVIATSRRAHNIIYSTCVEKCLKKGLANSSSQYQNAYQQRNRDRKTQTNRQTYSQADRKADKLIVRRTKTDRHKDKQICRQTDKHIFSYLFLFLFCLTVNSYTFETFMTLFINKQTIIYIICFETYKCHRVKCIKRCNIWLI
jgi:hypothetical protein